MSKKAIVLLSGGLDSTTALAVARSKGFDCYALSFCYGQKNNTELAAAKRIAQQYEVKEHSIIDLSILNFGQSALVNPNVDVPDYDGSGEIPVTYVPARNTIFLSIALGWAEVLEADHVFLGVSSVDYSGYIDCRPEYIDAFSNMANLATKRAVENHHMTIEAPLINLSKAETVKLGVSLGVDYGQTISCYQHTKQGACGRCDSCVLRRKGFEDADLADPTVYSE